MLPFFTIQGTDECCWEGCEEAGDVLGFCQQHYQRVVEMRHAALQQAGLDAEMPNCFDSQKQWNEYEMWWNMSLSRAGLRPAEPCTDCDPQTQRRMMECHRCDHPETVFVVRTGEMVGLNAQMHGWLRAAKGKNPSVIAAPDSELLEKYIRLHEENLNGKSAKK